jgi:hypothetical protein
MADSSRTTSQRQTGCDGRVAQARPKHKLRRLLVSVGFQVGSDARQGLGHAPNGLGSLLSRRRTEFALRDLAEAIELTIEFASDVFKLRHGVLLSHFAVERLASVQNFPVL